jgi:uncharacterized protein (TIGR03067 family)
MTRRLVPSVIVLLIALPLSAAPVPKHLMKDPPLTEAIKGRWQLTSRIADGVPSDAELVRSRTMVVGDGAYTLYNGGQEVLSVKFKVDATQQPAHFDVPEPHLNNLGVLKLEGDVLTLCLGPARGARATEFASPKGTGRILVTYSRIR